MARAVWVAGWWGDRLSRREILGAGAASLFWRSSSEISDYYPYSYYSSYYTPTPTPLLYSHQPSGSCGYYSSYYTPTTLLLLLSYSTPTNPLGLAVVLRDL